MEAKRRFVKTNNNIYEVIKETPCFFIVKDKRTFTEHNSYRLPKDKVNKLDGDFEECESVRPMCDIFFRTYSKHRGFFGQVVIDVETNHHRMHLYQ